MENFILSGDYIKLGQLLKAAGMVGSGVDAKIFIQDGEVYLNGEVCTMRGKKVVRGDIVSFNNESVKVI